MLENEIDKMLNNSDPPTATITNVKVSVADWALFSVKMIWIWTMLKI